MSSFWHPFANMASVAGNELVIDRGDGCYVYATDGKRYLDGTASLWYANVGYGRTEIAEAVAAQARRLSAYHTFGDFTTEPTERLADRIASLAPVPGSKVFFTSGGSDSVDTAAKLARRYFAEVGQPRANCVHHASLGVPRDARLRHESRRSACEPRRSWTHD